MNRHRIHKLPIYVALAFWLGFFAAGCQRSERASAAAERDSYQSMVQSRLNDFEHRFDGLEARMKGLDKSDQERLKADITDLRGRKDAIERKFKDMKNVSNESWRDIKTSLDKELDQLEMSYNVAVNNLGQRDIGR